MKNIGMDVWLAMVVTCLGVLQVAQGSSIKEIIDTRPELSMLKSYFTGVPLYTRTFAANPVTEKYALFAPNNDAFNKLSETLRRQFSGTSVASRSKVSAIMKYHTVPTFTAAGPPLSSSDFMDNKAQSVSTMLGSYLFYQLKDLAFYVNGARVVQPDIQADNGVVHIIDDLIYPTGESGPTYGFLEVSSQISGAPSFRQFFELLKLYELQIEPATAIRYMLNAKSTVFAPTDQAMNRIEARVLNTLKSSNQNLRKVIESHVIPSHVYHYNILNDTIGTSTNGQIPALEGYLTTKAFEDELYVSNDCAQGRITNPDITTSTGVVHGIDGILGFLYYDINQELNSRNDLRRFYEHVQSSSVVRKEISFQTDQIISDNEKFTIFAPLNQPMDLLALSQDDDLTNVLHMHMVRGLLSVSDMTDQLSHNTLARDMSTTARPIVKALFHRSAAGLYVEVNYLRARIIQSDICVKNGIIHVIDNVLGIPTIAAWDFIRDHAQLTSFYRALRDTGMDTLLQNTAREFTIFAPTDRAFEEMRKTDVGRRLLDDQNVAVLRRILRRHIISDEEIILAELTGPSIDKYADNGETITIESSFNRYYVKFNNDELSKVLVVQRDMRLTNGVVHVIEEVMFINSMTAEWTSGAHPVTWSASLWPLLLLLCTWSWLA